MTGGCKCHLISVKQNLTTYANVAAFEYTLCYCVVAYYILSDQFLAFYFNWCFNIIKTPG